MHIHNKQELCRDIADAFSFVRFLIKHPKMLNKIKNNAHIHILPAKYKKSKEAYYEGDDLIEIHYFRTGRQPDGLKTDDEFTPYIFKNNKYDNNSCRKIASFRQIILWS